MISFRYHLVSLMAIFLAIAFGIVIGAAVVDQATVNLLKDQLDVVEQRAKATDGQNRELQKGLDGWEGFSAQAGDRLVEGRLAGTPVLVVGVRGTPTALVESVRATLESAGTVLQGTLWLTPRLALGDDEAVTALGQAMGLELREAEPLRRLFLARLATTLTGGEDPLDLAALRDGGFLEADPGPGEPPTSPLAQPVPSLKIVVVSAPSARVRNESLAVPLVAELADEAAPLVVAVEPTVEAEIDVARQFVANVRADAAVAGAVSSVDGIDGWRGRVAMVLAIAEQGRARSGHYGTGRGATGLLPPIADAG